jgi:hypothetical protein
MSVRLESSSDGRVAVLHGVDTDAALRHLSRSLVAGCAFSDVRGLVIDLGGMALSPATADLLRDASRVRLQDHQVIATAASPAEVPSATAHARRWLDRFDGSGAEGSTTAIVRDVAAMRGLFEAGAGFARALVIRLMRIALKP